LRAVVDAVSEAVIAAAGQNAEVGRDTILPEEGATGRDSGHLACIVDTPSHAVVAAAGQVAEVGHADAVLPEESFSARRGEANSDHLACFVDASCDAEIFTARQVAEVSHRVQRRSEGLGR
jgi:hypothetical protein